MCSLGPAAAGPWHTQPCFPAPGERLRLTACKASPHLNFIYEARFPQTSSNLHRWPLTPRSKNTRARDSGPPFLCGRCAAVRAGGALPASSPQTSPALLACWQERLGLSACLLGRCLRCLSLWSVWGSRGVGAKARPSLDCHLVIREMVLGKG